MVQSTKELGIRHKQKRTSLFKKVIYGLCPNCGYEINTHKIGDGAAWFSMLLTSILVAIGALILEVNFQPKLWVHVIIWFPIVITLSVFILRPFKALLICITTEKTN